MPVDLRGADRMRTLLRTCASHGRSVAWAIVCLGLAAPGESRAAEPRPRFLFRGTPATEAPDQFAAYGLSEVRPGTSASSTRQQAVRSIPLDQLSADGREKAERVLKDIGLYRRLPTLSFEVEPEIYRFLLHRPDLAVSNWRALEISRLQLRELEPDVYAADAGDGSLGKIHVLLRTPEDTLIYCDGEFKSPALLQPIRARALMRFQSTFVCNPGGETVVTHYGDVFVQFPNVAVETIARTIAPISHVIADKNFKQISLFLRLISLLMSRQPEWTSQVASRMDGIDAQDREAFIELSNASHERAVERAERLMSRPPVAIDQVLTPFRKELQAEIGRASVAGREPRGSIGDSPIDPINRGNPDQLEGNSPRPAALSTSVPADKTIR